MDNLQVHKSSGVRNLIERAGARVLFLPPYSPDFSPIEEAFSKVEAILRRGAAARRSREALYWKRRVGH
jgi:transposase